MTTGTAGPFRPGTTGIVDHPGHADQKSHGRRGSGAGGGPGSGRDISSDEDALARVLAREKQHPEATAAARHAPLARAIADEQGFSGMPRVVTRQRMDELVAEGHVEAFRGLDGEDAGQHVEAFRAGDPFYTTNAAYGQGMYFTPDRGYAASYARGGGQVLRIALHKDAKVISYADAHERARADFDRALREYRPGDSPAQMMFSHDPGIWAMTHGYDAISATSSFGDEIVVLNRTAVFVEGA